MKKQVETLARRLRAQGRFSWTLVDQAMVSGSNFAYGLVLARHLGLDGFGRFSLAWMAVIFASTILDALVILPMLSIGPKQSMDEQASYYGAVILHALMCSGLSACVIFGLLRVGSTFSFDDSFRSLASVVAGATFTFMLQNFFRFYMLTNGRLALAVLCDAVSYPGQLLVLVGLTRWIEIDVSLGLVTAGLTSGFAALLGLMLIDEVRWDGAYFVTISRRHWNFGKWLAGSALIRWSAYDLFTIGAGERLGASAVGLMKSVQNVTNMFHSLYAGIDAFATPTAARRYHEGGRPAFVTFGWKLSLFVIVVTGSLLLVMMAAPGFWLKLFYGGQYARYGVILQWFGLIQFLMTLLCLGHTFLRTLESTRVLFASYVAATLVNLFTLSPLLQWWGLGGAVIGTALGRLVMLVVIALGLWHALRQQPVSLAIIPRAGRLGTNPLVAENDGVCQNV